MIIAVLYCVLVAYLIVKLCQLHNQPGGRAIPLKQVKSRKMARK